jgi:hypothetical protein
LRRRGKGREEGKGGGRYTTVVLPRLEKGRLRTWGLARSRWVRQPSRSTELLEKEPLAP